MPLPQREGRSLEVLSSWSGFELKPSAITTAQGGYCCPQLGRDAHIAGYCLLPGGCPCTTTVAAVL